MPIALEVRGLHKRFSAGVAGCHATASVLRDVSLSVDAGECVVVAGPRASGKSTLLLCCAGLISLDSGSVTWFGEAARAAALRRALFHHSSVDLFRDGSDGEPHVHLVDADSVAAAGDRLDAWISRRCERGDAVVVASRDCSVGARLGLRVATLHGGRLHATLPVRARTRVAEPAGR